MPNTRFRQCWRQWRSPARPTGAETSTITGPAVFVGKRLRDRHFQHGYPFPGSDDNAGARPTTSSALMRLCR